MDATVQVLYKHIGNFLCILHRVHFGVSNKLPTYSSQFRHVYCSIQDNVEQKPSRKTYKDINLGRIEMSQSKRQKHFQGGEGGYNEGGVPGAQNA